MSKVIICDKCGEIVKRGILGEDAIKVEIKGRAFVNVASNYDLCRECARKLAKWFDNKEEE